MVAGGLLCCKTQSSRCTITHILYSPADVIICLFRLFECTTHFDVLVDGRDDTS